MITLSIAQVKPGEFDWMFLMARSIPFYWYNPAISDSAAEVTLEAVKS